MLVRSAASQREALPSRRGRNATGFAECRLRTGGRARPNRILFRPSWGGGGLMNFGVFKSERAVGCGGLNDVPAINHSTKPVLVDGVGLYNRPQRRVYVCEQ
jgi:hypothetical protein